MRAMEAEDQCRKPHPGEAGSLQDCQTKWTAKSPWDPSGTTWGEARRGFSVGARVPSNVFTLENLPITWAQERKETAWRVLTPHQRCCQNQEQGPGFHLQPRVEDAGRVRVTLGFTVSCLRWLLALTEEVCALGTLGLSYVRAGLPPTPPHPTPTPQHLISSSQSSSSSSSKLDMRKNSEVYKPGGSQG